MENSRELIRLALPDNVLVARQEIAAGSRLIISGIQVLVEEKVQLGFKVAARKIEKGEKIIKYGMPIGSAITTILTGEIVHVHNIQSDYSPTHTWSNQKNDHG